MTVIMWQPSSGAIAKSQMTRFMHFINQRFDTQHETYRSLYHWSLTHTANFWSAVWDYTQIQYSVKPQQIYLPGKNMIETQWYIGAEFNFAENLLRHRNEKMALVFNNEWGLRRQFSYNDLYQEVAKLAHYFRHIGVKKNDRVAAILPNLPETVIAMLATTSIGAIWTSCSPDFGKEALFDRLSQIQPKVLISSDGYTYNGKAFNNCEKIQWLQKKISTIEEIIIVDYLIQSTTLQSTSGYHSASLDPRMIPDRVRELDDVGGRVTSYSQAISNAASTIHFEQLPFSHPVYILYSSGTTDVPKCIVHGAGGTLLQHLKELILHCDLTEQDTLFFYTTCGWMMWNWYITGLATGATLIQYDGAPFFPNPNRLLDLIDKEHISIFGTSAKYISSLEKAELQPQQTHKLTSLRTILSTGGPLLSHNFEYVYEKIKPNVCLSSISGGTDIISCFALGNPILPVYCGELQCIGLGMAVKIFDDQGNEIINSKGELVCTQPFPSMPLYFWNDKHNEKYHQAYFTKFPEVWTHGDYAAITDRETLIIYGRSDATLNPGGVRIGTAEIYRQVEEMPDIVESLAIGQERDDDIRIILFVVLKTDVKLDEALKTKIKQRLREHCSPRHVPAEIIAVPDLPKTLSGKIMELAVSDIINGRTVKNKAAIANPNSLSYFKNIVGNLGSHLEL